jgi:tetratricopeptide (TPR) repeat protein
MAKEWFAKAEEAEAAGDRQAAVRRYSCSLKLVPHPSTAYNLGTAAEKSGDLSMAVDAFKVYLDLAPDAADKAAIQARLARLEARLAELRQQLQAKPPVEPDAQPAVPGKPDLAAHPPGTTPPPAPPAPAAPPPSHVGQAQRTAGIITAAGTIAALGSGVVFNLTARSKMSDCRRDWQTKNDVAMGECDSAKTFAYTSYGLFGLAGALGVTSLTLLLWKPEDSATTVSFLPSPDGALLSATHRF